MDTFGPRQDLALLIDELVGSLARRMSSENETGIPPDSSQAKYLSDSRRPPTPFREKRQGFMSIYSMILARAEESAGVKCLQH